MACSMVSSLAVGCSNTQSSDTGNTDTKAPSVTEGETKTPAEETKKEEPVVTLKWHIRNTEPKNFDKVMVELNKYLEEKLNVNLDLVNMEPAQWGEKLPMMYAAGEDMDLLWAASWGGFNFRTNIDKGAFLALDDLIAEYGQEVYASMPDIVWETVKHTDGKIYGVPNYQIMADQNGLMLKKDIVDKYNVDLEEVTTPEGLLKWLQVIKDNEPDMYPILQAGPVVQYVLQADRMANGITTGGYQMFNTNTWEVIDWNHPDYKYIVDEYKMNREIYTRGFLSPDVVTFTDLKKEYQSGNYAVHYSRYKPGGDIENTATYGFEVVGVPIGEPIITADAVVSTLTAISQLSKNPEKAMQLISLVNTDPVLYNMLVFGIEGQDYVKDDGVNRIIKVPGTYTLPAWMLGNQFNAYLQPGQPDDLWDETHKLNMSAKLDPMLGFSFNNENVQVESTNLTSIDKEFGPILTNGLMDLDQILPQYQSKRKQAGHDKYMAEYQKQLTEWAEKNKK